MGTHNICIIINPCACTNVLCLYFRSVELQVIILPAFVTHWLRGVIKVKLGTSA